MIKPRLKMRSGKWQCSAGDFYGSGLSPYLAYLDWMSEFLRWWSFLSANQRSAARI